MEKYLIYAGPQSNGEVYHHTDDDDGVKCGMDHILENCRYIGADVLETMDRRLCERCQGETSSSDSNTRRRSLRNMIMAGEVETTETSQRNPWEKIGANDR